MALEYRSLVYFDRSTKPRSGCRDSKEGAERQSLMHLAELGIHLEPELGYILLYTLAYTFLKLIFQGHNGF